MTTALCTSTDVPALLERVDDVIAGGLQPTLALVFCAPCHDPSALGVGLGKRGLDVVGATTAGEVTGGRILSGSCAVMLWEADRDSYRIWASGRQPDETTEAVARRLGQCADGAFAHPAILTLASGVHTDGAVVVHGVQEGAGRPVPLYGGLAGDDLLMERTFTFTASEAFDDGLVALVLDADRYDIQDVATSGWQPVGIEKTVTRADGNVVFELDGQPILDVYREYLGLDDLRDGDVRIAIDVGTQYPLSVRRPDGTSVIRAPMFSDPETDTLIFAGSIPEGAPVRFCIPPSLDVTERVVAEAGALREALPDADAVLLISCKARHIALGPLMDDEVRGLDRPWDAPSLGFFSYGEIGALAGGTSDFHNETCTVVAFRERPAADA